MAENICCHGNQVNGHITQRDLNRYYLLDVYLQAHFSRLCVPLPGWFSEHSHLARPEKTRFYCLSETISSVLPSRRELTIFRYLNMFLYGSQSISMTMARLKALKCIIKHL